MTWLSRTNSPATDRFRGTRTPRFLSCIVRPLAAFALLTDTRKTEPGASIVPVPLVDRTGPPAHPTDTRKTEPGPSIVPGPSVDSTGPFALPTDTRKKAAGAGIVAATLVDSTGSFALPTDERRAAPGASIVASPSVDSTGPFALPTETRKTAPACGSSTRLFLTSMAAPHLPFAPSRNSPTKHHARRTQTSKFLPCMVRLLAAFALFTSAVVRLTAAQDSFIPAIGNDQVRKVSGSWTGQAYRGASRGFLATAGENAAIEFEFNGTGLVVVLGSHALPFTNLGNENLGTLVVQVDGKPMAAVTPQLEDRDVVVASQPSARKTSGAAGAPLIAVRSRREAGRLSHSPRRRGGTLLPGAWRGQPLPD